MNSEGKSAAQRRTSSRGCSGSGRVRKKNEEEEPVAVVHESQNWDLMAAAKKNVEDQALRKHRRENIMYIEALVKKASIVRQALVATTSGKKKSKVQRAKRESGSLQDYVRKYNVVKELASAHSDMNLGKILPGDAAEARKQPKKICCEVCSADSNLRISFSG